MLRILVWAVALGMSAVSIAESQVPLVRTPDSRNVSKGAPDDDVANWCSPKANADGSFGNSLRFCKFFWNEVKARKAAKAFWDEGSDVSFGKTINVLGTEHNQSLYMELLSDTWNTMRVSLAGVKNTASGSETPAGSTTTTQARAADEQSKTAKYLSKGGPVVFGVQRPLFVLTYVGVRTVGLMSDYASFNVPGGGESASDSLKFNEFGFDLQTQIDGAQRKINGVGGLHVGRAMGGKAFYRAISDNDKAFTTVDFTLGLLLENSMSLTWRKVIAGPRKLMSGSDLISVNFTR